MNNSNRARFWPAVVNWEGHSQRNITDNLALRSTGKGTLSGTSLTVNIGAGIRRTTYHFGAEDLRKPLLVATRALGSFVGVGAIAAFKVATDDAVDYCLGKGGVSRHKLERSLTKICKEGAYWGAAAGAFETFEFGAELMRGHSDWKNAMIGGALAGATVSAATSYSSHGGNVDMRQVIKAAIAGGAIGTAFEFISHRRHVDRFNQHHQLRTDDATDQALELTDEPNPLARSHGIRRKD